MAKVQKLSEKKPQISDYRFLFYDYKFLFWVRKDYLYMRVTTVRTGKRQEISTGIFVRKEDKWNATAQKFDKNAWHNQKLDACKFEFLQKEADKIALPKEKKSPETAKAKNNLRAKQLKHQKEMNKNLTEEQSQVIETTPLEHKLQKYADVFNILKDLGINYTHYIEIEDFSTCIESHEGLLFFHEFRNKNGGEVLVPISQKLVTLLEKYNYKPPKPARKYLDKKLKEIAKILGFENLSVKYARKTLANFLLNNGASIETTASALGHKDTTMVLRH
jgi:integrase